MKNLIFAVLALLLSACANLSKKDCETRNWYAQGEADGLAGETRNALTESSKACSKHGVLVDAESYNKGYEKGLASFCTYKNGQQYGRHGKYYHGSCPKKLEAEFLKGYNLGKRELEIERKEIQLEQRKQELDKQEAKLKSRQEILASLNTKECTSSSDCTIRESCSLGKCKKSGAKCSFDSDCEKRGRCSFQTVCVGANCDSLNLCKYD